MPAALVTGATSGIGLAFVRQLAADGFELTLVARNEERLARVAGEAREHHATAAHVLPADLSTSTGIAAVEARLRDAEHPVDLLVNNAGFTLRKPFLANEIAAEEALLDVMVRAVVRLTHAALPGMLERRRGAVVNVSSVAAWVPRGTYSAAKAYVTSFTVGLAAMLDSTGVRAMVLAPGFVRTELQQRAGVDMSSLPSFMWLDADDVVRAALRDLQRGKLISIPGAFYRAAAVVVPRLPRRALIAIGRRYPASRRRRLRA